MRGGRVRALGAGLAVLLSAAVVACQNTGALHVRTRALPEADFAAFSTYALASPPPVAPALPAYTEISGRKFNARIAARLEEAGLEAVPWEEADLQVALSVGGNARTDVWAYQYSWVASSVGSVRMVTGALQIDVVEREEERLVWQGQAWQETMNASLGEARGIRAVDRVMARYPEGDPRR